MESRHLLPPYHPLALAAVILFTLSLPLSAVWQYSGAGPWSPPSGHTLSLQTVPMDATVTTSPPTVQLRIFRTGDYKIFRKHPDQNSWSDWQPVVTLQVSSVPTTWIDTDVEVGEMYEYGVGNSTSPRPNLKGNVVAGIEADRTQPPGRMAVVVAEDVLERLPEECAQYIEDLELDGWVVHEIVTPRAKDLPGNGEGPADADGVPTAPFPDGHIQIRNQLIDIYNQYPDELKNVVLLGSVPVARTGVTSIGPDGHGNRAAMGADAYFADMDGIWTDTGNNLNLYPAGSSRTTAIKNGWINVAGDNKFDPVNLSAITPNQRIELGFGRIDTSNGVPGEFDGLRTYLNKLHRYKVSSPDFRPRKMALNRWQAPPTGDAVQRAMFRAMPGVVGMENIELIRPVDLDDVPLDEDTFNEEDSDAAWSRVNGPYLFYFKGSGVPERSTGSQAVIWTGLQSSWGWWSVPDNTGTYNAMAKRIAEDNMTLSYTWSIWDAEYLYHRMGMGYDMGDVMRVSMSDRFSNNPQNQYPVYYSGYGPLYMENMGCPSLRLFMFEPPSDLSVVPSGGHPALSWSPSPNAEVTGYHVYRSESEGGPYVRVTNSLVDETTYTDTSVSSGQWYYLVRAVRLETTGGGTFWNPSLGVRQGIDLDTPPAPPQVVASSLPDARWLVPYSFSLTAAGGTPLFTWELVDGSLPSGITLTSKGVLTGEATEAGSFNFTAQATDHFGQYASQSFTLKVLSRNMQVFYATEEQSVNGLNTSTGGPQNQSHYVTGPKYDWTTLVKFDLSDLQVYNGVSRARLVLTGSGETNPANFGIIKAVLTEPGAVWSPSTLTYATMPSDEAGIVPARAPEIPRPFDPITFDVTDMVRHTLESDYPEEITFRLLTNASATFGNETRLVSNYASGPARPTLVIETTDAPQIQFVTPTVNPAAIYAGSAIEMEASVTPRSGASIESVLWEQVSGPATVVFGSSSGIASTATFSEAGDYVLRMNAYDGLLYGSRDLEVRVLEVPAQTTPAYGTTTDLVVRFPFDESSGVIADNVVTSGVHLGALDSIGTPYIVPTWEPTSGRIGGALRFSGTGQLVVVPDSTTTPLDGLNQLSISVWFRFETNPSLSTAIFSKRTSTSSSTTSYALQINSSSRLIATVDAKSLSSSSSTVLEPGTWYHVVMIFNASDPEFNLKVYLNGDPELFGNVAVSTITRRSTTALRIGTHTSSQPSNTASFNGLIDEFRVYNTALDDAAILDLYQGGPDNTGPRITVEGPVSGTVGEPISLEATVTDDDLSVPVALEWSRISGPGGVTFGDSTQSNTTATAAIDGDYILRLRANDGSITTWKDLSAVVSGNPLNSGYVDWLDANGLPTDGSGLGALDASAMGDGVANGIKYALGLPVSAKGYAGRLYTADTEISGERYLTLTYVIPVPALEGVTYQVKASSDLEEWILDTIVVSDHTEGGLRTVTVRSNQPMNESGIARFIRLEVVVE